MKSKSVEIAKKLSPKRELFCQLYASDFDMFGNGTQAYAKAYSIDLSKKGAYKTASVNAARLLVNASILERIDQLLDAFLNDAIVDKQLAFLVLQNADFSAKLGAIREYNHLKKRTGGEFGGQLNIIALILKKWGLDDVGQNTSDARRLPKDGA